MDLSAETDVRSASERAGTIPERRPDFERPLVAILGLPFDAVTVAEAVQRIRAAAFAGRRCFVSTPNLNFAIAARADAAFRASVLRSDLSLVDGMPLVWIARLLGIRVPGRVAGADVFEALRLHAGPALAVYVFGGPEGAAAAACARINERAGGLRCVGFDAGGFGTVESLSGAAHIDRINRSGAQMVMVALGAKKGQAWIEHNAARLQAPVLTHLGAVVNFAAGALARAPKWMQAAGLEWAWRIKEEPALWRRYGADGLAALALLITRVGPDAFATRVHAAAVSPPPGVDVSDDGDAKEPTTIITLQGTWRDELSALRQALSSCAQSDARVVVDLRGVSQVSASLVALLLVAEGWFSGRAGFSVRVGEGAVARALRRKLASA